MADSSALSSSQPSMRCRRASESAAQLPRERASERVRSVGLRSSHRGRTRLNQEEEEEKAGRRRRADRAEEIIGLPDSESPRHILRRQADLYIGAFISGNIRWLVASWLPYLPSSPAVTRPRYIILLAPRADQRSSWKEEIK